MIRFMKAELKNERLVLDSKTEVYYLGHDLTLTNCTIVLRVPARALVVAKARFIGCTIEVKRELKNFRWDCATLQGCRITGRLSGNDFGPQSHSHFPGSIEDCDFTGAQLDGCRFMSCDVSTLRLPRWPCFTFLEPSKRSQELSRLPWPSSLRFMSTTFEWCPPNTSAVTFFAPTLVKKYNASEAELRAMLEQASGAIY